MKVLLLAGGFGTRISEESTLKPKPMIEIGEKPILWHIMKTYSKYGYNDFIVLLGYKGYIIKEYFANYFLHQSNISINLRDNVMEIHDNMSEPWNVTLLETGPNTMTGGRIKKAQKYIGDNPFMLTYGDGVADINISKLVDFHKSHGKLITMTSCQPAGKFGAIAIDNSNKVSNFTEKPQNGGSWINAGYFVCEPKVFDYIEDSEKNIFEDAPLQNLASDGETYAYKHNGFWQPMDTLANKNELCKLWDAQKAPWKVW
jgi:glucose-1-phosphate cytidylyltransferase